MPHIQIGLKGQEEMVVEHQDLASVMGNIGAEQQFSVKINPLLNLDSEGKGNLFFAK